ncbi:MAG: serine protein kinase RIO [Nanoarchaeota archaeon]|nr:serine protein kinase RIO [Nanoarchaeota archaeon]
MVRNSREDWKIYKNVFDKFTIDTVFKLITEGHIDGLTSPIEMGKESNIFLAEKDDVQLIAKIYRLESCNFNQMYSYIKSDPRYSRVKKNRRKVIFSWVQREYRNLILARETVNVPTPITFRNNIILMEMIGDEEPALQLKDLLPENLEEFFDKTVNGVKRLYESGLVHGDLSEFNILNHHDSPYFIDFSQGTSSKDPNSGELLQRDLYNLCRFFKKHRLDKDPLKIYKSIYQANFKKKP